MKHDIIIMGLNSVKKDLTNAVSVAIIDDAIEVVKAHAELERDVKRYFELRAILRCAPEELSVDKIKEFDTLNDKLWEVALKDKKAGTDHEAH